MKKLFLLLWLLPTGVFAQNQARMISGTNNITTCPYTIVKQDVTKLDVFITSSPCAVTLPAATTNGFGKGSIFSVKNNGTGTVTITPTGETIDNNASVSLLPGQGMDIYSTGTGYSSQPGAGTSGGGGGGINPPAGDIGGNAVVPTVISTHLNSPLPILQGGTGTQTPGSVAGTNISITGTWPNETFSALSACWQNNGSALTCEPFTNAVPPLVATLNVGNSTIDLTCPAAVGVGGSHASGCVPDPGASGTTTDYLGRDMAYHTSGAASTILPDPATSIQYVAGTCNGGSACTDANNGLSWGAAKLTISAAAQALPGGSTGTAGTGTIFVGVGAVPNAAGNQYGLWFMASADPNFGSPPTGWLKCTQGGGACNLNIVGVPNFASAPNGHEPRLLMNLGSQTVTTTPAIWLSDVATLHFSNFQFQYPGRAFVLGECSDGTRTGTCPVTGVTFDNVGALLNQTATNGPCTDITGQSYWLWFKDFGCGGNAVAATGGRFANNAAAMLIDGSTNNGNGLIHVLDSNFSLGGIKVIPGASGGAGLYADNITEEGDFTHDIPPPVWFTSFPSETDCKVSNIQIADAGPSGSPTVQNDGTGPGCTVLNVLSGTVQGANVIVNQDKHSLVNTVASPALQGQVGFFNGYVVGETDVARRIGGLTPMRFANNRIFTNPTSWSIANGTGTITTGQTDPFGGTQAASATTGSSATLYFGGGCGGYTPAAGDWLVLGAWKKNNVVPPAGPTVTLQYCGFAVPTFSATYSNGAMIKGDGQWSYVWTAYKVASGAATQITAGLSLTSAAATAAYGPTLYVIPNGTLSDNEVLEFASTMNSVDTFCPAGSICNVAGHPVSADTFSIRNNQNLNISAASIAANRTITAPDPLGSAALPLMTGSITNGNNVCASGTAGLITTVGCTGGGGGGSGTVVPALQNSITYYDTAGTVAHVGGVNGPTNNGINFWTSTTTAGTPGPPAPLLPGIPGRMVSGSTDTILYTDRVSEITYTNAGATAITLPGAGTTNFGSNFCFKMIVQGSGAVATITPGAGTINGGASQAVLQGQKALVCSFDNSNYIATITDPPAAAGTNIALTRSDSGLSFASSAGGGTVTHTGGALTAGQLLAGAGSADIAVTDLTGDCTTSGSVATTCTKLNGTAFAGTTGHLVSFGATNVPADSAVVAANVNTSAGNLVSGNLVSANGTKTTADSTIVAANVLTAASPSAATNQLAVATTTTRASAFKSLVDVSSTDYAADSGIVNALVACPASNPATALATGMRFKVLPKFANNNPTVTLTYCGLTVKNITKNGAAALASNDLTTTAIADLVYDGTEFQLMNPQTSGGGGSSALSSITAAGASNSISNLDYQQQWQWTKTSNSSAGMSFLEASAATNGTVTSNLANQNMFSVGTLTNSTANPLSVYQGGITNTLGIPLAQFSSTWNNAGLTAHGIVMAITDTSSASGSKFMEFYGTSTGTSLLASISKAGLGFFQGGIQTAGSVTASSSTANTTFQGGFDGLNGGVSSGAGTFRGAGNTSTTASSAGGTGNFRGGDETGATGTTVGGDALVRGGNVSSTNTGTNGGYVYVTGGSCTAVTTTGSRSCTGNVRVINPSFTTGTANANDLACVTASDTVASCSSTGTGQFVGVIESVTSNNVFVTSLGSGGKHVFNATSATFTAGHFVCQDASNAALVVDNGTSACAVGLGIGIVYETATTTTPYVLMRAY